MVWARMLAYITGTVDQELLLRNEYLAAENRMLKAQIRGRLGDNGIVRCKERLGDLLKYYEREAA